LRALEEENRQLKHIVAEQAVGYPSFEGGGRKKVVSPQMRGEAVLVMQVEVELSHDAAGRTVKPLNWITDYSEVNC
jgi:hypothetical protein